MRVRDRGDLLDGADPRGPLHRRVDALVETAVTEWLDEEAGDIERCGTRASG
ncbi:hypothetical protein O7599_23290 [Streptomyces sp. WMMC500]|uniref:hypothetical protein n=1 Tax=Streptomyces sp. WMMC500 TaxID=3015154 RepID=UPI00248C4F21|nr:hypothetical protein [Streptomyces sp. WMMC500]WBB58549.1 hypothetical protein O7599_23290 [Streptomyces sp. WMMC500]